MIMENGTAKQNSRYMMMKDVFPTSRLDQFGAQEVLTPSRSKLPHPKRGGVFHTNDQTQANTTPATACLRKAETCHGMWTEKFKYTI